MIDFKKLLFSGLRENDSEFLPNYLFREFRKAEIEHYTKEEFFRSCISVIIEWKQNIEKGYTIADAKIFERENNVHIAKGTDEQKAIALAQIKVEKQATTKETIAIPVMEDNKSIGSVNLRDVFILVDAVEKAWQMIDVNECEPQQDLHPRYFKETYFLFFERLIEDLNYGTRLADISFYFRQMQKDGFIYTYIGEQEFRDWLRDKLSIDLNSQLKTLAKCSTVIKKKQYRTTLDLHKQLLN
jgi:hypothetical protein